MARYGLVIDVTRCDGCGSCLLAVKDEYTGNNYPGYSAPQPNEGQNWLDLVEVEQGQGSKIKMDYIPVMYKHNRNLVLPEGVPEGAMYVREDGLTIIDPEKAKGCKAIVDNCKDGTIFWNEELQLPQIYTLDAHRLDEGESADEGGICEAEVPDGRAQRPHRRQPPRAEGRQSLHQRGTRRAQIQ